MRRSRTKPEAGEFTAEDVRQTALNLLARREHSVLELRQKLIQRDYPIELIDSVVEWLLADDLLSETRFAEVYAHSRVDKGYGPLRIRRELRERGVPEETISVILSNLDDFWMKKLVQVHRRRFGGAMPADASDKAQQMRFLRHRGFTLEQIDQLFRRD